MLKFKNEVNIVMQINKIIDKINLSFSFSRNYFTLTLFLGLCSQRLL